MTEKKQDYQKQIAMILPKWCINILIDHLDMQYDSMQQEQDFHSRVGDTKSLTNLLSTEKRC